MTIIGEEVFFLGNHCFFFSLLKVLVDALVLTVVTGCHCFRWFWL